MSSNDWTTEPCRNCGDETPGRYCPECGQRKGDTRVSMRRLLADVLEDQLSINSALPRTLGALFLKPGKLTVEYSNGRIASFIAPFRLYLVSSLLFFLTLSIIGRATEFGVDGEAVNHAVQSATADSVLAQLDSTLAVRADSLALQRRDSVTIRPNRSIGITFTDEDLRGDSIDWANAIHTGFPLLDSVVVSRARRLGDLAPADAIRELLFGLLQNAPTAMFLLLPVFALMLKILYFRSRRFYVEHFVFALHYHSFAFLVFLPVILMPDAVHPELLLIWLFLYLPIALKRVYGQHVLLTLLKWQVLSIGYLVLLLLTIFGTLIATFLLL